MVDVDAPLLWLLAHKLLDFVIDFDSFGEHVLQDVLATDCPQGDEGKLHDTGQYILHDVGCPEGVGDSVEQYCVDHEAHVVFGVHCLLLHVHHPGL